MGRARVPARREGVLELNGVFSPLIREGSGFGNGPAAAGRGRDPSQRWGRFVNPSRSQIENQNPILTSFSCDGSNFNIFVIGSLTVI
jgi:hypothetical protein